MNALVFSVLICFFSNLMDHREKNAKDMILHLNASKGERQME